MARRSSLLGPALEQQQPSASAVTEAATAAAPKRASSNTGKHHLGGYFDPADPIVEAFRVLAVRSRRSQQDLLAEAIADLVGKYETQRKFSAG